MEEVISMWDLNWESEAEIWLVGAVALLGSIYKLKKREILWWSEALQENAHAGVGSACGDALFGDSDLGLARLSLYFADVTTCTGSALNSLLKSFFINGCQIVCIYKLFFLIMIK